MIKVSRVAIYLGHFFLSKNAPPNDHIFRHGQDCPQQSLTSQPSRTAGARVLRPLGVVRFVVGGSPEPELAVKSKETADQTAEPVPTGND